MYPYIDFFGREIGTYGICMICGLALSFILAMHKGKKLGLHLEDLLIVSAFALAGALLCGSLLFVFVTYSPEQIWAFVTGGQFAFLASGIVFYGGLIGGVLGAFIGIQVAGCGFEIIERSVVPFIPLGHAIGRIGCVMAGCCYGFAYDGVFAIYYPNAVTGISATQGWFPVQPMESIINVGICALLLWCERKVKQMTDLLFLYLGTYAVSRFFLEMLRGDGIRGIWYYLSTSQIISIVLFAISVIGLLWKNKPMLKR